MFMIQGLREREETGDSSREFQNAFLDDLKLERLPNPGLAGY
jgi:hypothetical protein